MDSISESLVRLQASEACVSYQGTCVRFVSIGLYLISYKISQKWRTTNLLPWLSLLTTLALRLALRNSMSTSLLVATVLYQASKDDLAVYAALAKPLSSNYVNVSRWYNNIEAILRISGAPAEGCGVNVEGSAVASAAVDDDDDDVYSFGAERSSRRGIWKGENFVELAQLSRNAFAAGAARLSSSHQQNVEVDSKKSDSNRTVKYFIQELVDKDLDDANEELNFRALENGYVAITPLSLSPSTDADV
ncbi:hypothetical protein POM88_038319 [Heracleum sosnowskyi]|uniref:Uncharacterized protein n=1 Tax=Heracleum sosnowskyi TaxID=360622 RepID=A0AAD8HAL6_9APIA|nr:hypothetical protein POM88_038319 [Heracleum sosnowskyi]